MEDLIQLSNARPCVEQGLARGRRFVAGGVISARQGWLSPFRIN
jgi:hypothetical protein